MLSQLSSPGKIPKGHFLWGVLFIFFSPCMLSNFRAFLVCACLLNFDLICELEIFLCKLNFQQNAERLHTYTYISFPVSCLLRLWKSDRFLRLFLPNNWLIRRKNALENCSKKPPFWRAATELLQKVFQSLIWIFDSASGRPIWLKS